MRVHPPCKQSSSLVFVCSMLQVAEKIASYHIILEPVTAEQLFNSGGVVTEGGAVPAERSVSGGFFGVGGKGELAHHFFPLHIRVVE